MASGRLLLLLAFNLATVTAFGTGSGSGAGSDDAALELPHGPGGVAILIRGQSYRAHPGTTRATCHPLARRAQNRTASSLIANVVAPLERAGNVVRLFVTDCQPEGRRCEYVDELLAVYRDYGRELAYDVACRTVSDPARVRHVHVYHRQHPSLDLRRRPSAPPPLPPPPASPPDLARDEPTRDHGLV